MSNSLTRHSIVKLFLIGTISALLLRLFVVETYRVVSESMAPTLLKGDLILVSKSAFSLRIPFSNYAFFKIRSPERGELVAFTLPEHPVETFVKRVIAIEGDRVSIEDGTLYLNGVAADYQLIDDSQNRYSEWVGDHRYPIYQSSEVAKSYGPIDIPKGHFFVLGDNRDDSVDSRTWGPIPRSCLNGKVNIVWFSLERGQGLRNERTLLRVN